MTLFVSERNKRCGSADRRKETTDMATKEQISVCLSVVIEELQTEEYFIGFSATDAASLFDIVNDILLRLGLNIQICRGQC